MGKGEIMGYVEPIGDRIEEKTDIENDNPTFSQDALTQGKGAILITFQKKEYIASFKMEIAKTYNKDSRHHDEDVK